MKIKLRGEKVKNTDFGPNHKDCLFQSTILIKIIIIIFINISFFQSALADKPKVKFEKQFPFSIELTLKFNYDQKSLVLIHQRKVNYPAPRRVNEDLNSGHFIFQCENEFGEVLMSFPFMDPSIVSSVWAMEEEQTDESAPMTGTTQRLEDVTFKVVIPYNQDLAKVALIKQIKSDLGEDLFQSFGMSELDKDKIQSYVDEN